MMYNGKMVRLGRYDTLFEKFVQDLAMTSEQSKKIDDVLLDAISIFLSEYPDTEIYAQGSYAMGTLVRPLTQTQSSDFCGGEYDVDIALQRAGWGKPVVALEDVRGVLVRAYADKVDSRKRTSCERVYHSRDLETDVGFHADYVPIKLGPASISRYAANRRTDEWFESDTKKLAEWFRKYVADKPFVQALIVILKRIRDIGGMSEYLPSICITSIVCNSYCNSGSYASDLILALREIVHTFNRPHKEITIPLPTTGENLAEKLTEDDCRQILAFFDNCLKGLEREFLINKAPNLAAAREYLGQSFPVSMDDYPEYLESLRQYNLGIELDGSLQVFSITETDKNGVIIDHNRRLFRGVGMKLRFVANREYDQPKYDILWQVLNSTESPEKRGNIFVAKGKNDKENEDKFVNWETEQYDGEHWIKCFIYEKVSRKVVAIGRKFFVFVETNGGV